MAPYIVNVSLSVNNYVTQGMSTITHIPPSISYGNDATYGSHAKLQVADSFSAKNGPSISANAVPFASAPASTDKIAGAVVTPGVSDATQGIDPLATDPATLEALQSRKFQIATGEAKISSDIPNYHAEASVYMKQFIKNHFNKDIDPDHVYLNEYDPKYKYKPSDAGAIYPPDKTEISAGRLIRSTPLSNVAFANLYAQILPDTKRFRITANNDPNQRWADQKSLIEPQDFYDSLHDLDFKAYYAGKIDQFYAVHGDDLRSMAKARATLEVDAQHALGLLSEKDYALAQRALNPGLSDRNQPKVLPLEIGEYQSNDGLMIAGEGRVLVYLRGEETPLKGFDSEQDFKKWLVALGKKPDDLNAFAARHFSANDAYGRNGGPGVAGLLSPVSSSDFESVLHQAKHWFNGLFSGSKDIHDDPFGNLVRISQRHDKEDAEFDITSNADINERKLTSVMKYVPLPFASGLASWQLGKTKSQQEAGKMSTSFDALSLGVGLKFPDLSYGVDYGAPVWEARHGVSHEDPSLPYDRDDPDDPDQPNEITSKLQSYGLNNWNKSW
jgi:hypothetical protein